MELWPAQLQQRLNVDSFNYTFGNTLLRSDMDVGQAKVRSRFTDAIDTVTCSINLEIDEYETLSNFYRVVLANGSRTFQFNHPLTQVPMEARFLNPPALSPYGGRYFKVSMQWEIVF